MLNFHVADPPLSSKFYLKILAHFEHAILSLINLDAYATSTF
jgi:hypothetical protein